MAREVLRTLAAKVAPAHAAVLVIDVQNDFCATDGFYGRGGADLSYVQALPGRLAPFLDTARAAGVPVLWVQAIYDPVYMSDVQQERRERRNYGLARAVRGTWGADFYQLAPRPGELAVQKHRYSAFVDTDLPLILRTWGIRTLILTGCAADACVESTARDAFMRDYYVVFPSDGTAAYDARRHDLTLETVDFYYGVVCTLDEVVAAWQGAGASVAAASGARAGDGP